MPTSTARRPRPSVAAPRSAPVIANPSPRTVNASELGRRDRKKLATRLNIERVALELFSKRGYANVTIAEIAQAADVDPATFWRHFGSKEAVIFADIEDGLDAFRDEVWNQSDDSNLLEAVIRALSILFERMDQDAGRLRAVLIASDLAPEVRAYIRALEERAVNELAHAVAERLKVNAESDPRPFVLASAVMAASKWIRMQGMDRGTPVTQKAFVSRVAKVMQSVLPLMTI